jgi:glutamate N-acetyltransferase/amino-acid N-acetyltransferase
MISPALATMLCVVTTDAVVSPEDAAALLRKSTEKSFNLVTVDGEMSTNDSVFLMASGASGVRLGPQGLARLGAALDSVLLRLALMMVADGEGATKVMRLRVEGAEDTVQATSVARAIADSPLVKTAMHGSDPNWGRIISSAGAAMAGRSLPQARLVLCGVTAVAGGTAVACTPAELEQLRKGMQTPEIDIGLDLALGGEVAETFFADLGHEYVSINAEYHT